ncbi:hypothetical protein PF002_g5690 [Phytophthora fragariae]|uniref:Uncharacterized protein n=1 Tax=Phytophthora fragariae TaxID=53985 RepID=A0A6A3FIU3_9STRA|nr:hypothetical protein PF009_g6037 [Phytophthora fragariae]KAE9022781.1 hypothetical protein PF011_g4292 [Phytophthora fragariae]KAE9129684.1 hypothetical protein PF007_g4789 [Phytophthora fragariae]KAE9151464.1 hypothetical protein PF006_g4240 [Phytophthora fragariae]KAE9248607.1 hypothetical protein PF002_g5690 [Phytophthora fragariae]
MLTAAFASARLCCVTAACASARLFWSFLPFTVSHILFVYQLRAHPASVEAVARAGGAASAAVLYTVVSTSAVATADVG